MKFNIQTGDRIDEPEPEPETVSFGDNMSPPELRDAIIEYAKTVDMDVDLDKDRVKWEISHKMKRTAGKLIHKKGADPETHQATLRFAFKAYEKWGWEGEFESTIRHEMIHLKQFQDSGSADHGFGFKNMAHKFDTTVHCQKFSEMNYRVYCINCDKTVAERLKKSKLVKQPGKYTSKCCGASCRSEKL